MGLIRTPLDNEITKAFAFPNTCTIGMLGSHYILRLSAISYALAQDLVTSKSSKLGIRTIQAELLVLAFQVSHQSVSVHQHSMARMERSTSDSADLDLPGIDYVCGLGSRGYLCSHIIHKDHLPNVIYAHGHENEVDSDTISYVTHFLRMSNGHVLNPV
ncbi:uncharacterized protein CCOS01_16447 [Colletotrichum costaricense]|uniref:Uncharacterized protein n=1 Tax=Colletotrichum costaricense TaxID=1209916 RepID=A0AAI9YFU2_9PEZI|nr:uncharacterized protein CCOS01_16447 [Colletotrichum costaricense]KAK1506588.1 hypothetical protein CCOS01_16447 [Colletotrichum costaricense]